MTIALREFVQDSLDPGPRREQMGLGATPLALLPGDIWNPGDPAGSRGKFLSGFSLCAGIVLESYVIVVGVPI